jgi:hypothetical protein
VCARTLHMRTEAYAENKVCYLYPYPSPNPAPNDAYPDTKICNGLAGELQP